MPGEVVLNFNRQKLMGLIVSDVRRIETSTASGGKLLRCEFELESRRYKENASRVTIVTCVAEGKQAQEILEKKAKGMALLVTGNIGAFDELGPGRTGSHKLRISRVHFDYLNESMWAGRVSSEPYFNDKAGTVSFYISADRHLETIVRSRIKVIAREQSALLLKKMGPASSIGLNLLIIGEFELIRGEHVLVTNQVYPLLPQEQLGPIKAELSKKKERKDGQKASSGPADAGGRLPVVPEVGAGSAPIQP